MITEKSCMMYDEAWWQSIVEDCGSYYKIAFKKAYATIVFDVKFDFKFAEI
jgi:hypothetical protein